MRSPPDPRHRHRCPAEIIAHANWLYHVFSLSLRDVELILAERGVIVSHESGLPPLEMLLANSLGSGWARHEPNES